MKTIRWIVPALALALAAAGCILVSGQFLIDFALDDFTTSTDTAVTRANVDLTTESDYQDHKADLKSIADIAVLGTMTNHLSTPIGVEVYMTVNQTSYTTADEVKTNGVRLWGPFQVAGNSSQTVDWDGSAKLFDSTGKAVLLNEIKGDKSDGRFTLYAVADAGTYSFDVKNGVLALVLDFGK